MKGREEILNAAQRAFQIEADGLLKLAGVLGFLMSAHELEEFIRVMREAAKLPLVGAKMESRFEFTSHSHLVKLLELTSEEKERAYLALLYNDGSSPENAVPGRVLNKTLQAEFSSRNIRTPLGRLIEINDVEQIPNPIAGGHPSYCLTPKGFRAANELAATLQSQLTQA